MITEYRQDKCKYTYDKLKSVIYLVSEDHVKNIYCNGYDGHIEGLTQLPLRLNGFDIRFNEETSLDERYLFTKSVTLSMHGYVDKTIFGGRYYVILESMDGTFWMVNVDFPSRVTYTFNLSNNTYQTDFTLASYSNFPTLRLDETFEAVAPPCLGFNTFGVESLKLIEQEHADLNTTNMKVTTYGSTFKDIEFMGDSCSFQSQFDGEKCTDTLTFNIPFDAYKASWQYNLLEFTQNRYAAIIKPKSSENTIFAGFNFGLEPNYTIQTSDNRGESDVITITMVEISDNGMTAALRWSEEQTTETRWIWVKKVDEIICWECVDYGKARYLVQKEILTNGLSTGNYKVLEGYEDNYSMLNVVGTFAETEIFDNNACGGGSCNISTDIPLNISFDGTGCSSYSFSSECDWQVKNLNANWLTVSPMSGTAGTLYTIQVCNSTTDIDSTWFTIETDGGVRTVNVSVNDSSAFLRPSNININCLSQTVNFAYSPSCPITITSHDGRTTYQLSNGKLVIQVPRNETTSTTTYNYTATDCKGNTQTVHIYQDKTYERWEATGNYLCLYGASYKEMARYTGTTQDNINTLTDERRSGEIIDTDDPRCSDVMERWVENGDFMCIDGDKWSIEEQQRSYDDGSTWRETGEIRPSTMVESASTFCDGEGEVSWVLTYDWVCEEEEPETKYKATVYGNGASYGIPENNTGTITQSEVRGLGIPYSSITAVSFSDTITSIGTNAFQGCSSLAMVSMTNKIKTIGDNAFMNCTSLTSFTMTDSVTTVGEGVFYGCSNLKSLRISPYINTIGKSMCKNCYSLEFVTIPFAVHNIGNFAFAGCSKLYITVENYQPCTLDLGMVNVYHHFDAVKSISVPASSVATYANATGWSNYSSILTGWN